MELTHADKGAHPKPAKISYGIWYYCPHKRETVVTLFNIKKTSTGNLLARSVSSLSHSGGPKSSPTQKLSLLTLLAHFFSAVVKVVAVCNLVIVRWEIGVTSYWAIHACPSRLPLPPACSRSCTDLTNCRLAARFGPLQMQIGI